MEEKKKGSQSTSWKERGQKRRKKVMTKILQQPENKG